MGITVDRDVLPLTYLPIKYPARSGDNFKHGVTTCFPVMHSHYSNKLELLQVSFCEPTVAVFMCVEWTMLKALIYCQALSDDRQTVVTSGIGQFVVSE